MNCPNCGYLRMPPNQPMGYAGPVCMCPLPTYHSGHYQFVQTQSPAENLIIQLLNEILRELRECEQELTEEFRGKLNIAVKALEFYANANYQLDISQESMEQHLNRVYNDSGIRARQALAEIKGEA